MYQVLFLTFLKSFIIISGIAGSDDFACDFIRATDIAQKSSQALICDSANVVPDPPICEWNFVKCNSCGDVLDINVDSFSLYGSLPSSIGYLNFLISFSARKNYLTGNLPTQIGLLSNLILLDLSSNSFFRFRKHPGKY